MQRLIISKIGTEIKLLQIKMIYPIKTNYLSHQIIFSPLFELCKLLSLRIHIFLQYAMCYKILFVFLVKLKEFQANTFDSYPINLDVSILFSLGLVSKSV